MNSLTLGYQHPLHTGGQGSLGSEHVNNAGTSSFEVWNNFFVSAGIPTSVANDYAITFSQHRVRIDMMKDITKEILIDMGIKAMGDIIAILRHAKYICAQNELQGLDMKIDAPRTLPSSNVTMNTSLHRVTLRNPAQPRPQLIKSSVNPISSGTMSTQSSTNNKIQSRLSQNSGALLSAQQRHQQQDNSINLNNKRPSSDISLNKRPRISPGTSDTRFTEKTLTVILPSSSLSRVSDKNPNFNQIKRLPTSKPNSSSAVKSRLGPDTARTNSESTKLTLLTSKARAESGQTDLRNSLNSSNRTPAHSNGPNRHHSDTHKSSKIESTHRRFDDRPRSSHNNQPSSRPKSTVFNRLS